MSLDNRGNSSNIQDMNIDNYKEDISKNIWMPEKYDSLRKKLIPYFDMLYKSAVDIIIMSINKPNPRIIDIGAGTGLLSSLIIDKIPDVEITLSDRSESMLDMARKRFLNKSNVQYVNNDLHDLNFDGSYDAIVSALAIHHLDHESKKKLFKKIFNTLNKNGVFVNVEQVCAPDPIIEKMYDIQHEKHVIESDTPEDEWIAGRKRMKLDICAEVYDQINWLKIAGFSRADCLTKSWRFATYAAWK